MATDWAFYGRGAALSELQEVLAAPHWFFCRVQGRRRIGKTALLTHLSAVDPTLLSRLVYLQVPDSDEHDTVETFRRALLTNDDKDISALATGVTDFLTMAAAIGTLCRRGTVVVLDEFQYFVRKSMRPFSSFLQAEVDRLRDTKAGGLFVLGSLHTEMAELLNDAGAPLYGRLTHQMELGHWDFEDLLQVFRTQGLDSPSQWLTAWTFFEGVPKYYRDAYEQGVFATAPDAFPSELLLRMFLRSSSPLREEAEIWFLREMKGKNLSLLNYLAEHPGCTAADMGNALTKSKSSAELGQYLDHLVNRFGLVEKRQPVFAKGRGHGARYYIDDNFIQAWLAVVRPAREVARVKPLDRAVAHGLPRLETQEGIAFEKLVRRLHVECSRKGKGDFALTGINLGYWNNAKDAERSIEIDVVAVNEDDKCVRFGSCKRTSKSHRPGEFERHITAFLKTTEGRRFADWKQEKVMFSPTFDERDRRAMESTGYLCKDLAEYARLF